MKKIILVVMLIPLSVNAIYVTGGISIKTTTSKAQCRDKADKVVQAVEAWVKAVEAEDEALAAQLFAYVEEKEKSLKKCEKKASKWYNKVLDAVDGGSVGVGGEF